MGEILTPPTYRDLSGPLIFLAGPIQGAPDWQGEAIAILRATTDVHLASPRRSGSVAGDYTEAMYAEQVDWEHHHLERAAEDGVILFWLAREAVHFGERAYAQTSRFELGEAVTRHRWQGIKVVVGIEAGFSNERYLRRTIARKAPGIPLCSSLTETCAGLSSFFVEPCDLAMSRKRSPKERPEHDSNVQPGNREKHERGQRRKRMGQGKDRKRQQPDWFQR